VEVAVSAVFHGHSYGNKGIGNLVWGSRYRHWFIGIAVAIGVGNLGCGDHCIGTGS